ncbi:hypothetical protein FQZ97_492650 [compost metagenome]
MSRRPCVIDDRMGQRVLAALVQAGGEAKDFGRRELPGTDHAMKHRPALGERAGLVDDQRVDPAEALDRAGVPEEDAIAGSLAGGDHDRHGGGQAERARAGNDQDRYRIDQAEDPAGLRSEQPPAEESEQRDQDHPHHEIAGHGVRHPLHRGFRALGPRDHLHDLREHRLGADLLRCHHQAAVGIQRSADECIPGFLHHRHGLARQHGFIDGTFALQDYPVDRHLLPGANTQVVARVHVGERNIFLLAIDSDSASGLRRKAQERLDGGGGLRTRLEFEHLPEQGQRNDDRRRFEIDADAAIPHEGRRECLREHCGSNAVEVCRGRAQADQRPHVRAAVTNRCDPAHEERPAGP